MPGGKDEVSAPAKGINKDYQGQMRQQARGLFIEFDKQFDITSTFDDKTFTRDATKAKPLSDYPAIIKSYEIQSNLMLQRTLATTRAIHYTLAQKISTLPDGDLQNKYNKLLTKLEDEFNYLAGTKKRILANNDFLTGAKAELEAKLTPQDMLKVLAFRERRYNSILVDILFEANLDEGARAPKEIAELLFQYRLMASVLDPTPTVITTTSEKKGEVTYTRTQTATPITKKTDAQKTQLEPLDTVDFYPDPKERTYQHTSFGQHVRQAMSSLIKSDDRMLGSQARKVIPPTLKNTFYQVNSFTTLGKSYSFLRAGSPVYVGKYTKKTDEYNQYVKENFEQLKQAKKSLNDSNKINWFALVTNFVITPNKPAKDERKIMNGLLTVLKLNNEDITLHYYPVNPAGRVLIGLKSKARQLKEILRVASTENQLPAFQCASGQDRTGAVAAYYQKTKDNNITSTDLTDSLARGLHEAVMTTIAVPGSPFMKDDSRLSGAFPKAARPALFQPTIANTNKHVPILGVPRNIDKPSEISNAEFESAKEKLGNLVKNKAEENYQLAKNILSAAEKLSEKSNRKKLNLLTELLVRTTSVLEGEDKTKAILHLSNLLPHLEKQFGWAINRKFNRLLGYLFGENLIEGAVTTFDGQSIFMSTIGYKTLQLVSQLTLPQKKSKEEEEEKEKPHP